MRKIGKKHQKKSQWWILYLNIFICLPAGLEEFPWLFNVVKSQMYAHRFIHFGFIFVLWYLTK
jgi:hypothetical protein